MGGLREAVEALAETWERKAAKAASSADARKEFSDYDELSQYVRTMQRRADELRALLATHPDRAGQTDNASTPEVALTEEKLAVMLCNADDTEHHMRATDDYPCWHCRHKAERLLPILAARIAAHEAGVAARALRDAASDFQTNTWADVVPPAMRTEGIKSLAVAQALIVWLRDRADRLDAAQANEGDN